MIKTKKYSHIIYIGRMQPPTNAHISTIKEALQISRRVIVLLGSSNQPRTIKNPWTHYERASMILSELCPEVGSRIAFRPLSDYRYNDEDWIADIQKIVKSEICGYNNPKVAIIGHKKDNSSYYLDYFPQWDYIEVDNINDINATTVREQYFEDNFFSWRDYELISSSLKTFLQKWSKSEEYQLLKQEYECIKKYKSSWENSPYSPTFVTVDAVVIQSGHILLIQRKSSPGKGLWALPGGFINQSEFIKDAVIRELKEETKIKVPEPILRGSIVGKEIFDNPNRSLRGRTITHAFAFKLISGELSKVKGSDDASKAKWFPIHDVLSMEEYLFEDHLDVVRWAVSICK